MSRAIVAFIVSMMIVGLAFGVVALVASMTIAIFATTMLMVSQFTARGRKLSSFSFIVLLLVFGNLLENASHLVGCLTLLKESNHLERVGRHHLVQVCKLVLVCLRLLKEDLLTLLLRCGYFHCLTEVTTLEVVEKLHSTPH
jgi:hypothetical protein